MSRRSLLKLPYVLFLGLLLVLASAAHALSLDDAKATGIVGERQDGYLGIVVDSAEARQLIQEINSARRIKYQEIAKKNGTSLQAVEILAAKKAQDKTPSGQYVQLPSGAWSRKD